MTANPNLAQAHSAAHGSVSNISLLIQIAEKAEKVSSLADTSLEGDHPLGNLIKDELDPLLTEGFVWKG